MKAKAKTNCFQKRTAFEKIQKTLLICAATSIPTAKTLAIDIAPDKHAGIYNPSGDASSGTLIIGDNGLQLQPLNAYLYGAGYFFGGYTGNLTNSGSSNKNLVSVSGEGTASEISGGYALRGSANENTVNIENGTFRIRSIEGGLGQRGTANNNKVSLNATITSGSGWIAASGSNKANQNIFEITGGEYVVGNIASASAQSGEANGNILTISNATIKAGQISAVAGAIEAADNKLYINSSAIIETREIKITQGARIGKNNLLHIEGYGNLRPYSGYISITGGLSSIGNTLELERSEQTVNLVTNFDHYKFLATIDQIKNGSTIIKIAPYNNVTTPVDLLNSGTTSAEITFDTEGNGRLNKNDSITLISDVVKNTYTNNDSIKKSITGNGYIGIYNFKVEETPTTSGNSALVARITNASIFSDYGNRRTLNPENGDYNLDWIAGGYANGAHANSASENTLTINKGISLTGSAYGGYATVGDSIGNEVNLNGGMVTGNIIGGYAERGSATNNTINITGGTVSGIVAGGIASGDSVSGNTLKLNNAPLIANNIKNFQHYVFLFDAKKFADSDAILTSASPIDLSNGDSAPDADITVNITGQIPILKKGDSVTLINNTERGSLTKQPLHEVTRAGASSNEIYGISINQIDAKDGTSAIVATIKYAGLFKDYGSQNVFIPSPGSYTQDWLAAGFADGINEESTQGNSIEIRNGILIKGNVYGGYARKGDANGNTVILSGGSVESDIIGGIAENGNAKNNTIKVFDGTVRGSLVGGTSSNDSFSGNVLELHSINLSAGDLKNFSELKFYLPEGIQAGDTVLSLASTGTTDISKAKVGVGLTGNAITLHPGDTVILLRSEGRLIAPEDLTNHATGLSGISREYDFLISADSNALKATVLGGRITSPGIRKSPAEGRLAMTTGILRASDLIDGGAMESARRSIQSSAENDWAIFNSSAGGHSRYRTGSHINADSSAFLVGASNRTVLEEAKVYVGTFFETGFGYYNTYNNDQLPNKNIRGWGSSEYYGGGLLTRIELTGSWLKGFYTEASIHAGSLTGSYKSDDLNPLLGRGEYTSDIPYISAHCGIGYELATSGSSKLNFYTKYYWANTGDSTENIFGDEIFFDRVNSHRIRAGARILESISDDITPYVGGAFEYEFDATARGHVGNAALPEPTLEGASGMAELGMIWKPAQSTPLTVELGAQWHIGIRRGISALLQFRYEL